jgi:hypothetical protein
MSSIVLADPGRKAGDRSAVQSAPGYETEPLGLLGHWFPVTERLFPSFVV